MCHLTKETKTYVSGNVSFSKWKVLLFNQVAALTVVMHPLVLEEVTAPGPEVQTFGLVVWYVACLLCSSPGFNSCTTE